MKGFEQLVLPARCTLMTTVGRSQLRTYERSSCFVDSVLFKKLTLQSALA